MTERRSPAERLWARVDKTPGCWEWCGYVAKTGYGQIGERNGRVVYVHRLAYELEVGPIPAGLTLDHLCRNTRCVNPQHLEPVTAVENVRRGNSPWALIERTGACWRGHSFPENAYFAPSGYRTCRACSTERQRERRNARRSA